MLSKVDARSRSRDEEISPYAFSGVNAAESHDSHGAGMRPKLIIADEPTTASDVTIAFQIMKLLSDLQKEFHMSIILITHDIGLVASWRIGFYHVCGSVSWRRLQFTTF